MKYKQNLPGSLHFPDFLPPEITLICPGFCLLPSSCACLLRKGIEAGQKARPLFLNFGDPGKTDCSTKGVTEKQTEPCLFVCFHKRIWYTTGYEFRASPIEESYAYEVIPNYRV